MDTEKVVQKLDIERAKCQGEIERLTDQVNDITARRTQMYAKLDGLNLALDCLGPIDAKGPVVGTDMPLLPIKQRIFNYLKEKGSPATRAEICSGAQVHKLSISKELSRHPELFNQVTVLGS